MRRAHDLFTFLTLLGRLAGLLHDIGKAIVSFQHKIRGLNASLIDPARHERLSAHVCSILLKKFRQNTEEDEILRRLASFTSDDWDKVIKEAFEKIDVSLKDPNKKNRKTSDKPDRLLNNCLSGPRRQTGSEGRSYPVFTVLIQLILSHHFLPYTEISGNKASIIEKKYIHGYDDIKQSVPDDKLKPYGTPSWYDPQWLAQVSGSINAILEFKAKTRIPGMPTLLLYSFLITRPSLVSADQTISALGNRIKYKGDPEDICFANPYNRDKGEMAQTLTRHLIGAGRRTARNVELLRRVWEGRRLDHVADIPEPLKIQNQLPPTFAWQATAKQIAEKIRLQQEAKPDSGFFGIMAAGTGTGKTRCIPTFMSYLQGEGKIRFTLALGLRTLTEQSGKDYVNAEEVGFRENIEASVLIGGEFQDYTRHDVPKSESEKTEELAERIYGGVYIGHDSLFPADLAGPRGAMSWNDNNDKLAKMIQVPILVCTVDHLMAGLVSPKADASKRLIRTISSDLVIDEIDSFAIEDLRGLVRLVFLTGAAGRRAVLSSATIPPNLGRCLFEAYLRGYKEYCQVVPDASGAVHWAWLTHVPALCDHGFLTLDSGINAAVDEYYNRQKKACQRTITHLKAQPVVRKADFLDISDCKVEKAVYTESAYSEITGRISAESDRLHEHFKIQKDGRYLSVGLVRFSQTKHAFEIFRRMLEQPDKKDSKRVYVFYQARLTDTNLEKVEGLLNRILKRKHAPEEEDPIWAATEIKNLISRWPSTTHFQIIVVSTPIEEVGRDHDFDWGILEPTSIWSALQTPGRILRHRPHRTLKDSYPANIVILSHPMRALFSSENAALQPYSSPGPVKRGYRLSTNDAREIFPDEMKNVIDARYALEEEPVNHIRKEYDSIRALETSRIINDIGSISSGNDSPLIANWLTHVSNFFDEKYPFRGDSRDKIDLEVEFTSDGPKCRYLDVRNGKIHPREHDFSGYNDKFLLNHSGERYERKGKFLFQVSGKKQLKNILFPDLSSQRLVYSDETGGVFF